MKSMTGFGKHTFSNNNLQIEVQVKSVNSRFFDFRVALPSELYQYEINFKNIVNRFIKRGKVDLRINLVNSELNEIKINEMKVQELKIAYNKVIDLVDKNLTFPIEKLLDQRNIFMEDNSGFNDEQINLIEQTLVEAVAQHQEMALAEGENMKISTQLSLSKITESLTKIKENFPSFKEQIYLQIKTNVAQIVENMDDDLEKRILAEVAMYVEKADINEEIIRLESHIEKVKELIEQEGSIGKTFNFVLQEMHRETNTIGSKYNSSKLFKEILIIKEEIEKCREMIQNVE